MDRVSDGVEPPDPFRRRAVTDDASTGASADQIILHTVA